MVISFKLEIFQYIFFYKALLMFNVDFFNKMLGNHLLVPQFSINQSIRYSIKMFVLYVHTHCNGSIFES